MSNRLRLVSGLILFAYVVGHLTNHAMGVVSLDWMNAGMTVFALPWRSWPGTVLLLGAALVHVVLAVHGLYRRRHLKLKPTETVHYVLGFLIPFLLSGHIAATRGAIEIFDIRSDYTIELFGLWVLYPSFGVLQAITLLVVWTHGCNGIDGWLKLKPWYARRRQLAFALALLWPTLALAGYVARGVEVVDYAGDPAWVARLLADSGFLVPEISALVLSSVAAALIASVVVLGAVFAARAVRRAGGRAGDLPMLSYPGAPPIRLQPGATVLESVRAAGIPHASVCGGRGRCTTCRVRVGAGAQALPPAGDTELKVLERIAAPPTVRLACQLRPTRDLEVTPLLPPTASAADGQGAVDEAMGQEREAVVLFADMRGFTRMSNDKLPYDVVFVLNRYFAAMGQAVRAAGGNIDKFIGDGVMALFALDGDTGEGCRQAVEAARRMGENLAALNQALAAELPAPLAIGVGIHVGPVIVGEMGDANSRSLTAIGEVVNVASRLEAMTKDLDGELVASADVISRGGIDAAGMAAHEVEIRGRAEAMRVYVASTLTELPARG